ncbi:MAG: hypothetical protein FWE01_01890 [Firmicutes bacterium]|nr:hypothetical protein [Bacillota bacterium]
MANIEIVEIETRKNWRRFFRFPGKLYKGNSFYVKPGFKSERSMFSWKNPRYNDFILKAFLAIKGKDVVGRIAVVISKGSNTEEKGDNRNKATFTRFDFIDNYEVSSMLVEKVLTLVKRTGVPGIFGPVGFGDADMKGVLVYGFERKGGEIYNYAYYRDHIERLGFEKKEDFECTQSGKVWRIFIKQIGE